MTKLQSQTISGTNNRDVTTNYEYNLSSWFSVSSGNNLTFSKAKTSTTDAYISKNKLITKNKTGKYYIKVTAAAKGNYKETSKIYTVNITNKKYYTIKFNSINLNLDEIKESKYIDLTKFFDADDSTKGIIKSKLVFSSTSSNINLTSNGRLTLKKSNFSGEIPIKVKYTAAGNYLTTSKTIVINIWKTSPKMQIARTTDELYNLTQIKLNSVVSTKKCYVDNQRNSYISKSDLLNKIYLEEGSTFYLIINNYNNEITPNFTINYTNKNDTNTADELITYTLEKKTDNYTIYSIYEDFGTYETIKNIKISIKLTSGNGYLGGTGYLYIYPKERIIIADACMSETLQSDGGLAGDQIGIVHSSSWYSDAIEDSIDTTLNAESYSSNITDKVGSAISNGDIIGEVYFHEYSYNSDLWNSRNWQWIYRCTNSTMATKAANEAILGAANDKIGYRREAESEGITLLDDLVNKDFEDDGKASLNNINTSCVTRCNDFVTQAFKCAGLEYPDYSYREQYAWIQGYKKIKSGEHQGEVYPVAVNYCNDNKTYYFNEDGDFLGDDFNVHCIEIPTKIGLIFTDRRTGFNDTVKANIKYYCSSENLEDSNFTVISRAYTNQLKKLLNDANGKVHRYKNNGYSCSKWMGSKYETQELNYSSSSNTQPKKTYNFINNETSGESSFTYDLNELKYSLKIRCCLTATQYESYKQNNSKNTPTVGYYYPTLDGVIQKINYKNGKISSIYLDIRWIDNDNFDNFVNYIGENNTNINFTRLPYTTNTELKPGDIVISLKHTGIICTKNSDAIEYSKKQYNKILKMANVNQ